MVTHWEEATTALQTDRHPDGRRLTVREREQYLKKYLPGVSTQRARYDELRSEKNSYEPMPARRYSRRMSLSEAMFDQLCLTLYTIIQLLLSLFVRIRILYHLATNVIHGMRYNHYRNPRYIKNDIRNLNKLPRHLSVTLQLDRTVSDGGTSILNEAAEIVAWTASAGISQLSIYEKTGTLKRNLNQSFQQFMLVLGDYHESTHPQLILRAPNMPLLTSTVHALSSENRSITVTLLSYEDGRETLVDLTRTLTAMAQRKKLSPDDVSEQLIDTEICESVSDEPDLLILFTPTAKLSGYPPWQLRLTEIIHIPDSKRCYFVFIRALQRFARAEMRMGK